MALRDRLREELNASRKARNTALTMVLGTVIADIENHRISVKREISDDDVAEVIRKAVKRRRESMDAFEKGGRPKLAATERDEAEALARYLPEPASDEEVHAAVRAAIVDGATQIGAVMSKVVPALKGRAEGTTISRIAREELGTPR